MAQSEEKRCVELPREEEVEAHYDCLKERVDILLDDGIEGVMAAELGGQIKRLQVWIASHVRTAQEKTATSV